jgi:hypothetical protein
MTIDEFTPSATNRCVEAPPRKVFARVRLDEAEKSMAHADRTYSSLAPAVDRPPPMIADARGPLGPHLGGPHQHQAMWLSR